MQGWGQRRDRERARKEEWIKGDRERRDEEDGGGEEEGRNRDKLKITAE